MAIGVSMARRCPDQSKTEAARKSYVDRALTDNIVPTAMQKIKPAPALQSIADILRAKEAKRVAGGFVRGGHR